jgi:cytochrome c
MKLALIACAAAGILVAGLVHAQADLKAKGCLNCHETDKKKAGPSLKDIAAKYKDNKGATDTIAAKLKDGKGHPKVAGSDAELKSLVQAVLATK